jgi:hypothetical protein
VPDRKYHPLTFVAFLLAVFLLIMPAQADQVVVALQFGRLDLAILAIVITVGIVAAPLIYAEWQTRSRPEKYRPRLLSKITWAIIVLNVALNALNLTTYITHAG